MKWQQLRDDYERTKIGCLFAYVRGYDVAYFEWYVAPDDEDKNYRRAVAGGKADSMNAAKIQAMDAVRSLAEDLLRGLRELEGQS